MTFMGNTTHSCLKGIHISIPLQFLFQVSITSCLDQNSSLPAGLLLRFNISCSLLGYTRLHLQNNLFRNHSIESLFRPLVVSHGPTNKVIASHPGVQSPLKSDTRLSFHAVHHGLLHPSLTLSNSGPLELLSPLYLCSHTFFCLKISLTLLPAVILSNSHSSLVTQFILFLF